MSEAEFIAFLNSLVDKLQAQNDELRAENDKIELWGNFLAGGCEHLWLEGNGCVHSEAKTVICAPVNCARLKENNDA